MTQTVAEINISNFKRNLAEVRRFVGSSVKICQAVKADSYGHGALMCAKACEESGIEFLSVARSFEGEELRKAGIKSPILLLSLADLTEIDSIVENDITPLVFDDEYIEAVSKAAKKQGKVGFQVHLAVDTGMGRIGCFPKDAGRLAKKIVDSSLGFGGICTHFAVSDSVKESDRDFTELQKKNFLEAVENVEVSGVKSGIRHCAASAALFDRSDLHFDMVRPGIVSYGYYPGDLDEKYFGGKVALKPVMTLKTKICAIRRLEKGKSISYGRTFSCGKDTWIGVLPIGYADGLSRLLSNKLKVTVNGKEYSQVGRICMDQCMIDLGEDYKEDGSGVVNRWDEAMIFGEKEKGATQTAQEIADILGTISYEVTCSVSKRVPRIF